MLDVAFLLETLKGNALIEEIHSMDRQGSIENREVRLSDVDGWIEWAKSDEARKALESGLVRVWMDSDDYLLDLARKTGINCQDEYSLWNIIEIERPQNGNMQGSLTRLYFPVGGW